MIKAIIFDMDDVLTRRERRFSERLRDEFGIPTEKTLSFFTGVFQECLIGKADLKEEVQKYFSEWGWDKSVDELLFHWFDKEKIVDEEMLSYVNALKEKGLKVFIGTNNEKYRTDFIRHELGFGDVFHEIYASGYIGYLKPDNNFYKHILAKEKLQPDEVIFWDDKEENVLTANEIGIHGEVFTSYKDFQKRMEESLK